MISRIEAHKIAEEFITVHCSSVNGGVAVVDDLTLEKPYGWVFFYTSRRYLETGDPLEALGGNGPLVVTRHDGQVTPITSAEDPDVAIAEFERTRGLTTRT